MDQRPRQPHPRRGQRALMLVSSGRSNQHAATTRSESADGLLNSCHDINVTHERRLYGNQFDSASDRTGLAVAVGAPTADVDPSGRHGSGTGSQTEPAPHPTRRRPWSLSALRYPKCALGNRFLGDPTYARFKSRGIRESRIAAILASPFALNPASPR